MARANRKSITNSVNKPPRSVRKTRPERLSKCAVSPFQTNPDLRALTVFKALPPSHVTFRVDDDGSDPHLRVGEYAVIDMRDRELQGGELYLIQHPGGARNRRIKQATTAHYNIGSGGPEQVWFTCDFRGWRQVGGLQSGVPLFAGVSDGPYRADSLRTHLVGRVVGIAETNLGNVIESAAGYEDEDRGNAAFDANEYLDVLIATGHVPYLMKNSSTHPNYFECMPEMPMTDEQSASVCAVRRKLGGASSGLDRVKAECARRGLFG